MPMIQISRQGAPCQVDDFPDAPLVGKEKFSFNRSCEGSLYFRPGTLMAITQDELNYIKITPAHAALAARITVLPEPRKRVAAPKAVAMPEMPKPYDGSKKVKKTKDQDK